MDQHRSTHLSFSSSIPGEVPGMMREFLEGIEREFFPVQAEPVEKGFEGQDVKWEQAAPKDPEPEQGKEPAPDKETKPRAARITKADKEAAFKLGYDGADLTEEVKGNAKLLAEYNRGAAKAATEAETANAEEEETTEVTGDGEDINPEITEDQCRAYVRQAVDKLGASREVKAVIEKVVPGFKGVAAADPADYPKIAEAALGIING